LFWAENRLVVPSFVGLSITVPPHDGPITLRCNVIGNADIVNERGDVIACTRTSDRWGVSHLVHMIGPTQDTHTYTLRDPNPRTVAPVKRTRLQRLLRR
jgi:hypothetical protein